MRCALLWGLCLTGMLLSLACGQGAPTRLTISEASTASVVPVPTKVPSGPPSPLAAQPAPPIPSTTAYFPPKDTPTLGNVPGQRYIGRVILEIWEQGSGFERHPAIPGNDAALSLRTALAALEGQTDLPPAPASWPDFSHFKGGITAPGFRGRVVIGMWDSSTNAAATVVEGPVDDLIQRTIGSLEDAVQHGAQ